MIKKIKPFIIVLALLAILGAPLSLPVTVTAADPPATPTGGGDSEISGSVCKGTKLEFGTTPGDCDKGDEANTGLNTVLTNVVNIFSIVVGIIAVIMIIVGGLRYTLSGGGEGVSGAKKTVMYAIVGLIIVVLAQIIVHFVIGKVAGIGS